jgi:hypothetical protein
MELLERFLRAWIDMSNRQLPKNFHLGELQRSPLHSMRLKVGHPTTGIDISIIFKGSVSYKYDRIDRLR